MMPAKVTIFSGGGPELCFILLSLFHQERAFEKREHESFIVSTRRWFRCARTREQKSKSIRERKRNITRPICFDGRSRGDPPRKKVQRQRTTQKRKIRDKERKRTVGPALATMSTVSPLGTALTVPRSHPVTGMTRADESCASSREVLFCEEIWEEMASGFVTSFKNTTHIFRSTTRTYLRVLSCDVHIINTRERKASVRSNYLGSTRVSAVGGETGVFVTSVTVRYIFRSGTLVNARSNEKMTLRVNVLVYYCWSRIAY